MRGVIGGGNFIVDYVKTVDNYPAEQTLTNIRHEYTGSGGAPYNVLRSLAKLGADYPLRAIGRIGDDAPGASILEDCKELGIDTAGLLVTPGVPTSYTLVMVVEGSGKRTFFHQRGANALLSGRDFHFTGRSGYHFHYGYLLLLDHMDSEDPEYGTQAARTLANAKAAGLTTSIDLVSEDTDRFPSIVNPVLKHADIVFMNEFEASRLTGVGLTKAGGIHTDRIHQARETMDFPGTLVLHWAEGAVACDSNGHLSWQGCVDLPLELVASVVGSGDALAAGYLHAYLRGDWVDDCLKLGVCCAAASVTGFTCTDGVLPEADCLALGKLHGYRVQPQSANR
jgi:sugar/nucleoside kinase (ribokinase family)